MVIKKGIFLFILSVHIFGILLSPHLSYCNEYRSGKDHYKFLERLKNDSLYMLTSPYRLNKKGLVLSGLILGTASSLFVFDNNIRDAVSPKGDKNALTIFEDLTVLGNGYYDLGIIGALWTGGTLSGNKKLTRTSLNAVETLIIGGITTSVLKIAVGRKRPDSNNPDKAKFTSFSLDSQNYSFPSGHTFNAFALATSIASEYDSIFIDTISYSLASAVGFARIYEDVHWSSDVFFAAMTGLVIGKTIHYLNQESALNLSIKNRNNSTLLMFSLRY